MAADVLVMFFVVFYAKKFEKKAKTQQRLKKRNKNVDLGPSLDVFLLEKWNSTL
jgi:hypothetical protein